MRLKFKLAGLLACVIGIAAPLAFGADAAPTRLAVIAETSAAATALDVLTAELTQQGNLQLLERSEIERIYREQSVSAGSRDYLKLGKLLGADALLLLNVVRSPGATNLVTRLIAVKPGVIVATGAVAWPLDNVLTWAEAAGRSIASFAPKLTVLAKDAIPISVVNLRAATQSEATSELERQLTALTIQRLGQERELFVLERRRMELLTTEKTLGGTETVAFWNGSYLLEGVLDQGGFSPDKITLNVRLVPPNSGVPVTFEVSGSRSNYSMLINALATKINEALKINSQVGEWKAEDEAKKFYEEAIWALRWGMIPEAQSAAESAWALGKQDLDCALARVRSYVAELSRNMPVYEEAGYMGPNTERGYAYALQHVNEIATASVAAIFLWKTNSLDNIEINGVSVSTRPDRERILRTRDVLNLYYSLAKTLPSTGTKPDSPWYSLGVQTLTAAARELQHFHFVPKSQSAVVGQLAELRAAARNVEALLSEPKAVRDSYWVGNRRATHDELAHSIGEGDNIFRCKVNYGWLWQENPEDCIAVYRELLSSPVFCYLHEDLWFRPLERPRLGAWKNEDRARAPALWNRFVLDLINSTNLLLRLEGKALVLVNVNNDAEKEAAFKDLFTTVLVNGPEMQTNNVELLYLSWGLGRFAEGGGIVTPTKDKLDRLYRSDYSPKLRQMEQAYWSEKRPSQTGRAQSAAVDMADPQALFDAQKLFLKSLSDFDSREFSRTFRPIPYTKEQAAELKPLLATYKTNLIVLLETRTGIEQARTRSAIARVGMVERRTEQVLNPSATVAAAGPPRSMTNSPYARPSADFMRGRSEPVPEPQEKPGPVTNRVTNTLLVKDCVPFPRDKILSEANLLDTELASAIRIQDVRWRGGNLLFDVRYSARVYFNNGSANLEKAVTAILIATNSTWSFLAHPPESKDEDGLPGWSYQGRATVIHQGSVYLMADNPPSAHTSKVGQFAKILKYDTKTRRWEALKIPVQGLYDFQVVNDRLFAVNGQSILEITDGGRSSRVLASVRRRPATSVLDSLENLGSPILFQGDGDALRVSVGKKIYEWEGDDWREVCQPDPARPPEIVDGGIIFRSGRNPGDGAPDSIWFLARGQSTPELCLRDKTRPRPGMSGMRKPDPPATPPKWKSLPDEFVVNAGATHFRSNLFLFVDHAECSKVGNRWVANEKDGMHAKLVCLNRDYPEPIVIPLKFDTSRGLPPLGILTQKMSSLPMWETPPVKMQVVGERLYFAQSGTDIWSVPLSDIEAALTSPKVEVRESPAVNSLPTIKNP